MPIRTKKVDFSITVQPKIDFLRVEAPSRIPAALLPKNTPHDSSLLGKVLAPLNLSEFESFQTFAEVLLHKSPKTEDAPLLTPGATAAEDEIANISFFVRTLMPESVPTEAIGVTTGENVFQGAWAAFKSIGRFKKAMKINDQGGMFEAGIDGIRGVSQSIGGAAYLGYRGTMIASQIYRADTSSMHVATPLGQSAYALGFIGNVMFGIFYLMIGVWASYSSIKDWQFSFGMNAQSDDSQLFDFLVRKVNVDPRAKLAKLKTYWNTLPEEKKLAQMRVFKDKLADSALSKFASLYLKKQEAMRKEGKLQGPSLNEIEAKAVFKLLFAMQENNLKKTGVPKAYLSGLGLNEEDLQGIELSTLQLIGFNLEESRRLRKKEAKFSRVVNGGSAQAIKKAAARGLNLRLRASDIVVKEKAAEELALLKGRVTVENTKNKRMHVALAVIAALGIATTVLGFIALPPAGAIALIVLTLLLCGGMMLTDGYCLLEGWKKGGIPGRYDKTYVAAITAVLLAALGVSIGVTLGFGLPLLPLILAAGIAAVGLGFSGTAFIKLIQKEKQWKEDHPDLMTIKTLLDSMKQGDRLNNAVTSLYKKLSKSDRLAIRKKYGEMSKLGELGFKTERYTHLNKNSNFGEEYLALENKEHDLLIKAMKKTVKFFWEKAAQTKSEIDQARALKMQGLYDRVSLKITLDDTLAKVKSDPEVYDRLKNDIWFVVKHAESAQDLSTVIDRVIADKALYCARSDLVNS